MIRSPRTHFLFAVLAAVIVGGCSGGDASGKDLRPGAGLTTTSTSSSTTTTFVDDMTTVTTYPAAYASPLNGLKATDSLLLDRRAVAVKVDNHPNARPQSGIETADAMLETIVEGGFTRFIALFHDDDAEYIGPIRSLRPIDSALAAPINAPLGISGGQGWIQSIAVQRGVGLIGETQGYFRVSGRRAPHNLYSSTLAIRDTADRRGWSNEPPPGLFPIDTWWIPDEEATTIVMEWSPGGPVRWEWDPEGRVYSRWNGEEPHMWVDREGEAEQVSTHVLIVIKGEQYTERNPAGTGSAVPAIRTTGSGEAMIFAVGRVWHGTWERETVQDPFSMFELDGTEAPVPSGIPWIAIFPEQREVTYE